MDGYDVVQQPSLMASAADRMDFQGYSKLLPRHTRRYTSIGVGLRYSKIERDGIRNNISINLLTRMAKGGRQNVNATSDSRKNVVFSVAKEVSTEEAKNSYGIE